MTEPRVALERVASLVSDHFGARLRGLYLFGSLAAGGFYPGKSDLDLLAVIDADVEDGEALEALAVLHAGFVAEHPDWRERVEIGYVSHAVLQTLADLPTGPITVISPGEPLNRKAVGADWVINWHSVLTSGETIVGPPPQEIGPGVTAEAFTSAIERQLDAWTEAVRAPWVAYVPTHQGYIVVTVCRCLYALSTGELTTKENAVAWTARRYPEWADFITAALEQYRADLTKPHAATVAFVDYMLTEADRPEED